TGKDAWGRDRSRNGRDDDGNGYTDDRHGWNFEQDSADLTDMFGHGTQSAGVVAGMGAGGRVTGLAPEAQVMVLRACCLTGSKMFESHAWEAIQYAMAQGARVISMSLSIKHEANPNDAQWRRVGEALLAAG